MKPLLEMGRYIAGSISLTRAKRQFGELLGWEAAQDIHTEIVTEVRQVRDVAHAAETYDREALRELDVALADDGVINAEEAKKIRALVTRSAEADHNASELAAV
jgi:hypothetical protein